MPGMAPRTGLEGPEELGGGGMLGNLPEPAEGEEPCPECGAPLGEPHDPRCPMAEEEGPDPDRWHDSRVDREMDDKFFGRDDEGVVREGKEEPAQVTEFDKFMDRTLIDERRATKVNPKAENNVQRQRAARIQDRPMNKT